MARFVLALLAAALVSLVSLRAAIASPIKNVVLLMEENRSFDHMMGFLNSLLPVDGLNGTESNPVNISDPSSGTITINNTSPYIAPFDPCHGFDCVTEQIYGTTQPFSNTPALMNGFAQVANEEGDAPVSAVLNMFAPPAVPIISTLAQEFVVFDRWFCSVPGPTNPNRRFLHAATSCGSLDDADYNPVGFNCSTVFDRLDSVNKTWRIYYSDWSPSCMFQGLRTPQAKANFFPLDQFFDDVKQGNLPHYAFIEPRMYPTDTVPANDQHPDHSVLEGERLMKDVYEVLRASDYWNDTLFVVTYDEHGGFYDHVAPPVDVPNPDGRNDPAFNFTRLGIRVPTLLISPWVDKGVVVHDSPDGRQWEHSSFAATFKEIFGWSDFLTRRDAWAASFDWVLTNRTSPRTDCPLTLPAVPPSSAEYISLEANKKINDLQRELLAQVNTCYPPSNEWEVLELQAMTQGEGVTQAKAGAYARKRFAQYLAANTQP